MNGLREIFLIRNELWIVYLLFLRGTTFAFVVLENFFDLGAVLPSIRATNLFDRAAEQAHVASVFCVEYAFNNHVLITQILARKG